MIYIYDRNEKQIDVLDVIAKFTQELGKFNTLEFDSEKEFEKGYRIIYPRGNKYYEFVIVDTDYTRDEGKVFNYFCQDSIIAISGNPIIEKRPKGNINKILKTVLEGTRWEFEVQPDYESINKQISFFRISSLEAFQKTIKEFNTEWTTDIRVLGDKVIERKLVIKKLGTQANSRLEFGKNIVKFSRKILPNPIITALYGYGKGEEKQDEEGQATGAYGRRIDFSDVNGGKAYVENNEAKEIYGIGPKGNKKHSFGFFIDENITDKKTLLEATKKELERVSQIQAEYTVEAANIFIDCHHGDTVPILDEEINFSGNIRIIKTVEEGDRISFTFGHVQKTFTDSIQKMIEKSTDEVATSINSKLNEALKNINLEYLSRDGYVYNLPAGNEYNLPGGIYTFDKPIDKNPTYVTYVGGGQVLIADEKSTDGGWKWKTAIDGRGVAGESIITNSITANKLASDVGQSLDLSSNKSIIQKVKDSVDEYVKDGLKLEGVKNVRVEYAYSRSKTEAPRNGWKEVRE